jgi:transposase InsO family protein
MSHVGRHIGARDVVAVLERLFGSYGKPQFIRSDNGREFISETTCGWLATRRVEPIFIEKGSPQQNPFVDRFNGTMRDELLNGEHFDTVLEQGHDRRLGPRIQHAAPASRPRIQDSPGVL